MNSKLAKNIIQVVILALIALALIIWTFLKPKVNEQHIAIFVTGVMENNYAFKQISTGVLNASMDINQNRGKNIKVEVIEGGKDKTTWDKELAKLAESHKYELIISSGAEFPDLAQTLTNKYPELKFIIFNSDCDSALNIASFDFDYEEIKLHTEQNSINDEAENEAAQNTKNENANDLVIGTENATLHLDKLAEFVTNSYFNGKIEFGTATKYGTKGGFITYNK